MDPINAENGADPKQPERELGLPDRACSPLLKRTWREDRKPANVLLVLPTRRARWLRGEARGTQGRDWTCSSSQVAPQDRVGLMSFSDEIPPRVPVGPRTAKRGRAGQGGRDPA